MNEKRKALFKQFYDSLTPEQAKKAKACKTTGELKEFAATEGIELPDEMLSLAAGGAGEDSLNEIIKCPKCGSTDVTGRFVTEFEVEFICNSCGYSWS